MDIKDITEKKENSLEGFGVLVLIAGVIMGVVGIVLAMMQNEFICAVYGITGFISAYIVFAVLITLAENHCMLRSITEERIERVNNKEQEIIKNQKDEEEKNESDLKKIIDSYNKNS